MAKKGLIFNIQRFTIHDGPGIRTEIFFKGCPLCCPWCGNPEGQRRFPEPGVYLSRCIGSAKCGFCKTACPKGATAFDRDGGVVLRRESCVGCTSMECIRECPADALKQWGREYTVEELMELIRRDKGYFASSGGGVTLSGGEVLLQRMFASALLAECRREGIHTCVETTLYASREEAMELARGSDLMISDLKCMDSAIHRRFTGVENGRILDNLIQLAAAEVPLILRIPVIPGFNDTDQNMWESADFILYRMKNRIVKLQLLEYLHLGEEKYRSLGRKYPMRGLCYDQDAFTEKVRGFARYFRERGIVCTCGTGEEPEKGSYDTHNSLWDRTH